ncbi:hypothetical protein Tco_0772193 [Tanacetum coccineum]|uniref:Uncharacterized protein n=1 Tax=Tanacetum coccineum TaxID=301880 RepID=A0ABQ4ZK49_9ASTR
MLSKLDGHERWTQIPPLLSVSPAVTAGTRVLRSAAGAFQSSLHHEDHEHEKGVNVVWMMKPGDPKSFKKLFTINEPYASIDSTIMRFSKNGETVMETRMMEATGLEAYEVFSRHMKDLGITKIRGSFSVTPYTESLLLCDEPASNDITADL